MSTTVTARPTVNPVGIAGFAALAIVLPHVPSFFHRLLDGDEAIYGSIAALMNTDCSQSSRRRSSSSWPDGR